MRNILKELELEEYIAKPHTSAGRVPTDKGYRYYVDNLAFSKPKIKNVEKLAKQYDTYKEEYEHPARASAKLLSQLSQTIAVSGWLNDRDIHEAGLSRLFEGPEGENYTAIREISALLDNIDVYIEQFARQPGEEVRIYIGEENPVLQMEYTSVLARTMTCKNGDQIVMLLIGPKSMSYKENVPLLNEMASIIEHT